MVYRVALAVAFVLAGVLPTSAAPILQLSGTFLIGASRVDVNGVLYDVRFRPGTCGSLFTGCDDSSDFQFITVESAAAASHALLDQVLLDGPLGNFDSEPGLTLGCGPIPAVFCGIFTPFAPDPSGTLAFHGAAAHNSFHEIEDFVLADSGFPPEFEHEPGIMITYAVWTPTPLPEPTSLTLLGLGLAGVGVHHWRWRQ